MVSYYIWIPCCDFGLIIYFKRLLFWVGGKGGFSPQSPKLSWRLHLYVIEILEISFDFQSLKMLRLFHSIYPQEGRIGGGGEGNIHYDTGGRGWGIHFTQYYLPYPNIYDAIPYESLFDVRNIKCCFLKNALPFVKHG